MLIPRLFFFFFLLFFCDGIQVAHFDPFLLAQSPLPLFTRINLMLAWPGLGLSLDVDRHGL